MSKFANKVSAQLFEKIRSAHGNREVSVSMYINEGEYEEFIFGPTLETTAREMPPKLPPVICPQISRDPFSAIIGRLSNQYVSTWKDFFIKRLRKSGNPFQKVAAWLSPAIGNAIGFANFQNTSSLEDYRVFEQLV